MALPEIKVGLGLSLGKTGDFQPSTAADTPKPYKDTPFEDDFNKANPTSSPTPSYAKLSLEGVARDIKGTGIDAGVQLGLGDWSLSGLVQYRYPVGPVSLLARGTIGAEWYSGDANSRSEMKSVPVSGAALAVTAGFGAEFVVADNFPLQVQLLGIHYNPTTDMGHGFELAGGPQYMFTISVGWNIFGSKNKTASTQSHTDGGCKEAADGFQLGPNTLNVAVAKCSGSALPVFEAMAKKIGGFKLESADAANHNEYRVHLKQFAAGIAAAATAGKLTSPEAVRMMKVLAGHYYRLAYNMLNDDNAAQNKASLEAGLEALLYPYIPLLKLDPADGDIKKKADEILAELLGRTISIESAGKESYLPIVLEKLVEICKDSTWLTAHKKEFLGAAKEIADRKTRLDTIKLINKSL